MSLRQYADGILGWSRFQPERGYDFNSTAIVTDRVVLLVDPVPATDAETRALHELGERFEIVLLNADHERDAATFQRDFDASVLVARADLGGLKLSGAAPLDDGAELPGGWTFRTLADLKTPGESVLLNIARRLCVIGDAVIADPVTGLRLVPAVKIKDRGAALRSLGVLASFDFDGLLCGDGFQLPSGGREALKRFLSKQESL